MKKLHVLIVTAAIAASGSSVLAQTTKPSAYGARLANPADPTVGQNSRRINNRISSRINSRIANRIERYEAAEPTAAFTRATPSSTQAFQQAATAVQQPVEDAQR